MVSTVLMLLGLLCLVVGTGGLLLRLFRREGTPAEPSAKDNS